MTVLGKALPLLGAREIAIRLGVSRQRVQQLADRDDFPKPFQELSMGRVWWESQVDDWIRRWRAGERICGPRDDEGEAFRLLAERVADYLAEGGQVFIEDESIGPLGELLGLFLAKAGNGSPTVG
ncbi:helix-turn-helix transcriptional regulator [Actinoplanes sp. HUAS TT8]|uniref:helix-turn-helix transcriptional regulator n=1 Tax=Actinoplanes sp. HUAS TT8 TaxID=3447453 RepID=UPI003F52883E